MERALHTVLGNVGWALSRGVSRVGRLRSRWLPKQDVDTRPLVDAPVAAPTSDAAHAAMIVAASAAMGETVAGPLVAPIVDVLAGAAIAAIAWRAARRALVAEGLPAHRARWIVRRAARGLHARRATPRASVSLLRLTSGSRATGPLVLGRWALGALMAAARNAVLEPIPLVASPRKAIGALTAIHEAGIVVAAVETEAARLAWRSHLPAHLALSVPRPRPIGPVKRVVRIKSAA
ncbi:MAG: hypothetical protein ACHREM_21645 [Polyangiales bacterium]